MEKTLEEKMKYHYLSEPIYIVMENIDKYVIPENIRAIEYLWDKNILTTQTNDYFDDFSFISFGELSEENHKIFYKYINDGPYSKDEPHCWIGYGRGIRIPIAPNAEKDTFEEFKKLIDLFKFQDVQKDGYMTIEEFYLNFTDCYKYINNIEHKEFAEPQEEDYKDKKEYIEAYKKFLKEYEEKIKDNRVTKKVFDPTKQKKTLEEYLKEAGLLDCYDEEEGKIFYNKRLYEGHMKYKNTKGKKTIRSTKRN